MGYFWYNIKYNLIVRLEDTKKNNKHAHLIFILILKASMQTDPFVKWTTNKVQIKVTYLGKE